MIVDLSPLQVLRACQAALPLATSEDRKRAAEVGISVELIEKLAPAESKAVALAEYQRELDAVAVVEETVVTDGKV